MKKNKNYKQFQKRRELVDRVFIFCAACIFWILIEGKDTSINANISTNAFWLLGSVVAVYIGGRSYHDVKMLANNDDIKEIDDKPCEDDKPDAS